MQKLELFPDPIEVVKILEEISVGYPLFSEYSLKQVHFFHEEVSDILSCGLSLLNRSVCKCSIVDLGCGDGSLIFALSKKGLLKQGDEVVGVDLSEIRIKRLKSALPFVRGIVSSALHVNELPNSSFNFVICTQLIEHVSDDHRLLLEIKRLLGDAGTAYVSTVIKKRYGVYFYFRDGSFRLDPTHVREYSSSDEFIDLVLRAGLDIIVTRNKPMMFPILDLAVRIFIKLGFVKPNVNFFGSRWLQKAHKLKVPIIGYRMLEVLARQK